MKNYNHVKGVKPRRSLFDLSYRKTFTCDMGQLIPIMCDEAVPGDVWEIGNEIVCRLQPMIAPVLHEINIYVHYYFVPYRLLWNLWESFITGGTNGTDASVLPRWVPSAPETAEGKLWDYMGFPTGSVPAGVSPMDFPRNAYNLIYNQYYRDENLQAEISLTNGNIMNRAWEKDYFTSSLPWQQRGVAPALPISGTTSAIYSTNKTIEFPASSASNPSSLGYDSVANVVNVAAKTTIEKAYLTTAKLNANTVDLSGATTFDVSDLRLVFQIQKWMERNARAGVRYTEFLRAHYGVAPRDDRMQRAEYIGGSKSPMLISEVLQTAQTGTTPQGNMAGHGLSADRTYIAKYNVEEFGLIMGIMSIMPRTAYAQRIDRQWNRTTKFDFYSPEFANLSEQDVIGAEVYGLGSAAENTAIFGYQGRYDEMRVKHSQFCGKMRSTYSYWHMGRIFTGTQLLNSSFITSDPTKRIFASTSEPGCIVNVGNRIRALRPLPYMAEPGLIDHN